MQAISGLMSVARPCPECDGDEIVNYWKHSETENVVRYQCGQCSTQVTDLDRMPVNVYGYILQMSGVLGIQLQDFVDRFGDKPVMKDDEVRTLSDVLESAGGL